MRFNWHAVQAASDDDDDGDDGTLWCERDVFVHGLAMRAARRWVGYIGGTHE